MSKISKRIKLLVDRLEVLIGAIQADPNDNYKQHYQYDYRMFERLIYDWKNNRISDDELIKTWIEWESEEINFELFENNREECSAFFHRINPTAMGEYVNLAQQRQEITRELYA